MKTLATFITSAIVAAAAFAVPATADKGGVPHNGGGNGNEQAAQPAQPAVPTQSPATPATPDKPAKDHGKHNGPKPRHSGAPASKPKKQHPVHGDKTSNSHANAGKTTICHATGSSTNPYVEITISNNAIPAHRRHQDGRDIIPAPAEGCPGGTGKSEAPKTGSAKGDDGKGDKSKDHGKTTICHATGSDTNPYVEITISDHAVAAHRRHQDGHDIIPAPAEGCPGATQSQSQAPPPAGDSGQAPAAPTTGSSLEAMGKTLAAEAVAPVAVSRVLGAHAVRSAARRAPSARSRVLGARATSAPVAAVTPARSSGGGLPFTGFQLGLLIAIGLAALLGGVALRRSATVSRR